MLLVSHGMEPDLDKRVDPGSHIAFPAYSGDRMRENLLTRLTNEDQPRIKETPTTKSYKRSY